MAEKNLGRQTVKFNIPPSIIGCASIVGPKEGEGPLGKYFDNILEDEEWGEKTWEKSESKLIRESTILALKKSNKSIKDINYIFAGDLLNQCSSTNFGLRDLEIPFYGLYGACSTCAEGLSLASMIIDGGFADYTVAATSSHFCSAERQFRLPLEQGGQRPMTAQWTVTGGGAFVLAKEGSGPYITYVTTGKIIDLGIKDANNMGAAMAPAAADTIYSHFEDTGMIPADYDLILTGDLASVGKSIVLDLLEKAGCSVKDQYNDCGLMIYTHKKQDTHAGGSGCGCSAAVLAGYIYSEMMKGNINKVLFVGTGALMSPTSTLQGETIPCIAHAVTIQRVL